MGFLAVFPPSYSACGILSPMLLLPVVWWPSSTACACCGSSPSQCASGSWRGIFSAWSGCDLPVAPFVHRWPSKARLGACNLVIPHPTPSASSSVMRAPWSTGLVDLLTREVAGHGGGQVRESYVSPTARQSSTPPLVRVSWAGLVL